MGSFEAFIFPWAYSVVEPDLAGIGLGRVPGSDFLPFRKLFCRFSGRDDWVRYFGFGWCGPEGRIIGGSGGEHGAEHFQISVGDAAQGAAVGVTSGAQRLIVGLVARVMPVADHGPVEEGLTESGVAGTADRDLAGLSGLAGDWSSAGKDAQGAVISKLECPRGLSQQSGGDTRSNSRQGENDGGVTLVEYLGDFSR